jgi:serine/threonine protein kinase
VLIDDSHKAVLCDFGLTRIKADATSRTARVDGVGIMGSRNWMAPEQLLGKSLKPPCDIYAFGMTLYEVSLGLIVSQTLSLNQRLVRFVRMRFHSVMWSTWISSSW